MMSIFVSYAQNFEDVLLWRVLKKIDKGFYVDVGAQHPMIESVSRAFYERGWRGIHIEPQSNYADLLRKDRPDETVIQAAVSTGKGLMTFYDIPETGLSTLNRSIAERHRRSGYQVVETSVPILPLSEVLKQVGNREIHWLKIDVEGWEEKVLKSWGRSTIRPWVVVVESTLPLSQEESYQDWEGLLLSRGYQFAYFDGLNRFYVHENHEELLAEFSIPPNIFDHFLLSRHTPHCSHLDKELDELEKKIKDLNENQEKSHERIEALSGELAVRREAESRLGEALEAERRRVGELEERNHWLEEEWNDAKARIEELNHHAHYWYTVAENRGHQLEAVYASRSWKVTAPLRKALNILITVKVILFRLTRKVSGKMISILSPRLYFVRSYIESKPRLLEAVKFIASTRTDECIDNDFIKININEIEIRYSKGPLADVRGIGRVSREILRQFKFLSETSDHAVSNNKVVHFFSSIHWCPKKLPPSSVVMVHDVIPLLFPSEFPDPVIEEWDQYKEIVKQADCIVTISNSSKNDISRLLGVPKHKIRVVYNGVTELPVARKSTVRLPENPYIVFLGSYDHHKNADVLFRALCDERMEDVNLIMVGDNKSCLRKVRGMGLIERVYFLGRLPDDDVGYVIKKSLALVFPSYYEGFGLPPMEALLLGVPVICSNRPAMNELLKGGAIFADPDKPEEWVQAIDRLLKDEDLRFRIAYAGQRIAKGYTWEKMAKEILRVFKLLSENNFGFQKT